MKSIYYFGEPSQKTGEPTIPCTKDLLDHFGLKKRYFELKEIPNSIVEYYKRIPGTRWIVDLCVGVIDTIPDKVLRDSLFAPPLGVLEKKPLSINTRGDEPVEPSLYGFVGEIEEDQPQEEETVNEEEKKPKFIIKFGNYSGLIWFRYFKMFDNLRFQKIQKEKSREFGWR